MNPFMRKLSRVLMLTTLCTLHLGVAGAFAALKPDANYLGRITGVIAPVRLAVDPYGKLYVADPRSGGVLQYNSAGKLLKKFSVKGARGVAITPAGELVVTHGKAASVINTDTGVTLFQLTSFKQANGVTVDDTGLIYIVDSLDSVVQVFLSTGQPATIKNSAAGKPSNSFGTSGALSGQLSLPTAISYDTELHQLVVSDTGNSRLMFFDKDGAYIRSIGGKAAHGTAPAFTSPQSVSLEYTKTNPKKLQRIYVSDSFQGEVQIIDPQGDGTSLGSIGGYGSAPGQLKVPVDTLYDPVTSRLLIANGAGDITIYGINVTSSAVTDTTPPLLTIDPVPVTTFTNAFVIGGSVEKNAQIQITASTSALIDTVSYYPSPDASLSYWQAAISALAAGSNTITVTARDSAANPTVKTAVISYASTALAVSIADPAAPVNNPVQVLSGTVAPGATVTLTGPAGVTFDPAGVTGTTWQSTVYGLGSGINTITVTATKDGASSSATTRITYLSSKPHLEVSTLPDGSKTAQPVINVSGVLPLDSYFGSLTVNGAAVTVGNNTFSTPVTLKPGANVITILALDKAGNSSVITRTITLDETLPVVTVTEPADGSYVNGTSVTLKGTVPAGNTIRLLLFHGSSDPTGTEFTQVALAADGSWSTSAPLPLDPGLNTIVAEVTDQSGKISLIKTTVTRDATVPALTVTGPIRDIAVNKPSQAVTGTVTTGSDISATLNGVVVPVTFGTGGTYTIPITLTDEKPYALAITATDATGNSVTSYRNLVYDVTAPKITPAIPANPLKVTFSDGVPVVLDKNGAVAGFTVTVNADGSKTVDGSDAAAGSYDLKTLNIYAVDAAGNSSRNGDVTGDGKVDIKDALKALRISLALDVATPEQMLRGDVGPLVNGVSKTDGVINGFDLVYILEKIVGLR
jgi:hypothetical protein